MFGAKKLLELPTEGTALPGRDTPLPVPERHFITGHPLKGPFPVGLERIVVGMGCFWGAERKFWTQPGVFSTSVGYAGGITRNPTYEEVCSGRTGHTEVVQIVFDPTVVPLEEILRVFWENHDPTQGMRQGNDVGTQYRSAVYATTSHMLEAVHASRKAYQERLTAAGHGTITTEVGPASEYYFAEEYHQQYLGKNPHGYCGLGGTGVTCPMGAGA